MLTLAVSAVSVHLMHFVCLRRKFTVCWLNMSKFNIVSPVLAVTPTSLFSSSYLCIRYRRVSITVRICCTSAKDPTLFFKTFRVSEAFSVNQCFLKSRIHSHHVRPHRLLQLFSYLRLLTSGEEEKVTGSKSFPPWSLLLAGRGLAGK